MAMKRLNLDAVWWLISPQNPLKPVAGMAPFAERFESAKAAVAHHPRLKVTDIETKLGSRYTADTLAELRRRFPGTHFVWLIGADNLQQIHRWNRWERIFHLVPVAVFARPAYSLAALSSVAAHRFAHRRVLPQAARRIATMAAPAWVFFPIRLDPASATALRRNGGAAPKKHY
jgi:nicotinate-nucleotide adenylyltransferase